MVYIFSFCLFFVLSILLAIAVWNLPVWCQSWTLTSVWGIAMVGLYTMMIFPESVPYIQFMGLCFLGAFPGMLWLEFRQRWARVHYWESNGLPEPLQNKPIYWSHHANNLAEWIEGKLDEWAYRRLSAKFEREREEAVAEAERMVNEITKKTL